jgi:hypothetical protein
MRWERGESVATLLYAYDNRLEEYVFSRRGNFWYLLGRLKNDGTLEVVS